MYPRWTYFGPVYLGGDAAVETVVEIEYRYCIDKQTFKDMFVKSIRTYQKYCPRKYCVTVFLLPWKMASETICNIVKMGDFQ